MIQNDLVQVKIDEQYATTDPEYEKVHNALVECYKARKRYRIYLGDTVSGRVWLEEHDTVGYISLSSGAPYKRCFLLIKQSNSYGGGSIAPQVIVGIQDVETRKYVYRHPKMYFPRVEAEGCNVYYYTNGEFPQQRLYANCSSPQKAMHLADFLLGKRFVTR